MRFRLVISIVAALLCAWCANIPTISGGSTTTDNAKVTGRVYYATGLPASGAKVRMRSTGYLQPLGAIPDSLQRYDTLVDDSGRFVIDSLAPGKYHIEVNDTKTSAVLLTCQIKTTGDSIALPADTLRRFSAIAGKLDSADALHSDLFVRVYSLERLAPVDSTGSFFIMDLPAGTFQLQVVSASAAITPIIVDSVRTRPDSVTYVLDTPKTVPLSVSDVISGQWSPATGPYVGYIKCIAVTPSGDLFAGTEGGGVCRSIDDGATWTAVNTGLTNKYVQCLAVSPDGNNLYAGTQRGIFLSSNSGAGWTAINNGLTQYVLMDIQALVAGPDGSGNTILFAGTKDVGVFRSVDNGANWTIINNGAGLTDQTFIRCLALVPQGTRASTVFAGTGQDGLFRSGDNGATWAPVTNGLTNSTVLCLATASDGSRIFAGADLGVFVSTDTGSTWAALDLGQSFNWIDALVVGSNGGGGMTLLAGSSGVGIFLSGDTGATWTAVNTGLSSVFVNALATSGTALFAGTDYDGMFVSRNNGASWTASNSGLMNVTVTAFVSAGTDLFAGTGRGVFRSPDYGDSWMEADSGMTNLNIQALGAGSNGTGGYNLFAAPGGKPYLSTDNGAHWISKSGGWTNISVTAFAASGITIFAGADNGGSTVDHGIFTTTSNGATWSAANTGLPDIATISVRAFLVDGTGGTTVFAGTSGGGIFRSTNTGAAWTAVNSGLSLTASANVYALVSGAKNGGGTTLVAGTADGLFLSTDNGATWTSSSTGLPAYATVVSLTARPSGTGGTVFFAATGGGPAYDGVYLSLNNGITWTAIHTGLNSTPVYALHVHGGFLFAGTQGNGVWKIGLK